MRQIKAIGLDMDHTIVRYKNREYEKFVFNATIQKLIEHKGYPQDISSLTFDYDRVIQGLVIDKNRGNLLKLSRFGKVKKCYHGTELIPFGQQQKIYSNRVIDLNDPMVQSLDTAFAISNGVLYGQLIDFKEKGGDLPSYDKLADDTKEMLDLAHRTGTIKEEVRQNLSKYIVQEPELVTCMERYKRYGKKLLIITNSDFDYTKLLLDYTINPYLKEHKSWKELFDITITFSMKPRFFNEKAVFLKIDPATGLMSNTNEPITNGIFQGGNATKLQEDLELDGNEILYLGDHIYGDVVATKKICNWRTAMVLEPLGEEITALAKTREQHKAIALNMAKKEQLEQGLNELYAREHELGEDIDKDRVHAMFEDIEKINQDISSDIVEIEKYFNPYWGELMRAGQEEGRFADQVEKYACIYMVKIADLFSCSPRTYFRPKKRIMPHDQE
jgi:HAD superfamily 5'-nucleotidase-like hydrolase